jgi:hypothetical protein
MTFSQWTAFIFDHPVAKPEWYWKEDPSWRWPKLDEACITDYLTRLFQRSDTVLLPFTNAQLDQGLNLLISPGSSDYMFALRDQKVPLAARLHCLQSMLRLFADCFAKRCTPHQSHLDAPGRGPLNSVCYMWWDVLPIHGLTHHKPEHPDSAQIDQTCLAVMKDTLALDSLACRESALHGLGHWKCYYPDFVKTEIDAFLERNPGLPVELHTYALAARQGRVQ